MLYCPTCGTEERQAGQFCRACGTDMRAIRITLERPDDITASAVSAREQISRVFAEKIREAEGSRDLERIAEDVLPNLEKFLESPQEKRLRRARAGVLTSATGLGAAVLALLLLPFASAPEAVTLLITGVGLSVLLFLIGIGLIINSTCFTVPRKQLPSRERETQRDEVIDSRQALSTGPMPKEAPSLEISSVTEHTTQHLGNKR